MLVGGRETGSSTIWFEAILDWSAGEDRIYYNLFQEAESVGLHGVRYLDPVKAGRLDEAFTLDGLEKDEGSIKAELARIKGSIDWVSVYDVGQGNANSLCDQNETPLLYYDLGGSVQKTRLQLPSGADGLMLRGRSCHRPVTLGLGPLVLGHEIPVCLGQEMDRT